MFHVTNNSSPKACSQLQTNSKVISNRRRRKLASRNEKRNTVSKPIERLYFVPVHSLLFLYQVFCFYNRCYRKMDGILQMFYLLCLSNELMSEIYLKPIIEGNKLIICTQDLSTIKYKLWQRYISKSTC